MRVIAKVALLLTAGLMANSSVYAVSSDAKKLQRLENEMQRLQNELNALKGSSPSSHTDAFPSAQTSTESQDMVMKSQQPFEPSTDTKTHDNDVKSKIVLSDEKKVLSRPHVIVDEHGQPIPMGPPGTSSSNPEHIVGRVPSNIYAATPGVSYHVLSNIYQMALNYIHGVTVTTSPILGLKSAWDASDLLYQIPSMNEDLRLLQQRDEFNRLLHKLGGSLDIRPLLVISGALEGTVIYTNTFVHQRTIDVNLATGRLDIWPIISSWANGFLSINFDSSPPQTGSRVANSRLFLQRGFLTIGNLEVHPVYFTIGQFFMPFGRYATSMDTTPQTMSIARVEQRAALLGFFYKGFYGEVYGFRGDRISGGTGRTIFQGGGNFGYTNSEMRFGALDIGAGYITNIADSQGMQNNGILFLPFLQEFFPPQFGGFSTTINNQGQFSENLKHNVGAYDVHMELSIHQWKLITEFISATRRFDAGDLMYNNRGAYVRVTHNEIDYNFTWGKYPFTLGGAYEKSWDSLALNVPRESWIAVLSASFWKNTQQSIEYRHDNNYPYLPNNPNGLPAVGGGGSGNINFVLPVDPVNTGGTQNLITILFGVYF